MTTPTVDDLMAAESRLNHSLVASVVAVLGSHRMGFLDGQGHGWTEPRRGTGCACSVHPPTELLRLVRRVRGESSQDLGRGSVEVRGLDPCCPFSRSRAHSNR